LKEYITGQREEPFKFQRHHFGSQKIPEFGENWRRINCRQRLIEHKDYIRLGCKGVEVDLK
jgi:hypothetical protein